MLLNHLDIRKIGILANSVDLRLHLTRQLRLMERRKPAS